MKYRQTISAGFICAIGAVLWLLSVAEPAYAKLEVNPSLKVKLEDYLKYDVSKDIKKPEFIRLEDQIVKDVFTADELRDFYVNLYTVNQVYIANSKDPIKAKLFQRLDLKMQKEAMKEESRRNKIRIAITAATTIVGAAGAWYGIHRLTRFMESQEETKFWFKALKWGGKKFFTVLGVAAGGCAGYYAGTLGSAVILGDSRFYLDPIDDEEDFGSILDDFLQDDELNGQLLKQKLENLKKPTGPQKP